MTNSGSGVPDSFQSTPKRPGLRRGVLFSALVLAIAAGAYLYWRFVYYPTTPQYALREFLDAAIHQQYATAYRRLYLTPALQLVLPSEEALKNLAEDAGGIVPRLQDYHLGRVRASQDRAVIDTVLIARRPEAATSMVEEVAVEMVRDGDVWKVDGAWAVEETIRRAGKALLHSVFH